MTMYQVGGLRGALLDVMPQSRELTTEQARAMAAELTDPRYAELDDAAAYREFCTARYVPNPEPQGRVHRPEWRPDELRNALLQMMDASGVSAWAKLEFMRESTDQRARVLAVQALATFGLQAISLENQLVAQGIRALVAAGVLTEPQREWLCTMPDPAWSAEVLEPAPSDVILGTDCLPGWSDFMAARGRRG